RGRHLAPGGYDRARAVAVVETAVRLLLEMLRHLLLDDLPWGVEEARRGEAQLDGFLARGERLLVPGELGHVERDVEQHLDRGVEQDRPLDELRSRGRQLEREPAAEARADEGGT